MWDTFLEASVILHTILGISVVILLLYLRKIGLSLTFRENGRHLGHMVGKWFIIMHLYHIS